MPPPPRTTCKLPDCNNPAHVYPGGWTTPYCQEHMSRKKLMYREGFQPMSGQMQDVLTYMREQRDRGCEFVELRYPLAHGKTIKTMIERDWIFESPGVDGVRYKITHRGLKALQAYACKPYRKDGICPRCGQKPRHVRSSGDLDSYCIDCLRVIGRRKQALGKFGDPNRPCSRCGKRPRHRFPGGKLSTYCQHCGKVVRRKNNRKAERRLFKAISHGAPVPPCQICKQRPRRVFANCVAKYCTECGRDVVRKSKLRASLRKHGLLEKSS